MSSDHPLRARLHSTGEIHARVDEMPAFAALASWTHHLFAQVPEPHRETFTQIAHIWGIPAAEYIQAFWQSRVEGADKYLNEIKRQLDATYRDPSGPDPIAAQVFAEYAAKWRKVCEALSEASDELEILKSETAH